MGLKGLQCIGGCTSGIFQIHQRRQIQIGGLATCYHVVADSDSQDTVADGVAFLRLPVLSSCL